MTASLTTGAKITRGVLTLAAAGLAGVALTACTPDQHPTTEKGTTPPVATGNQVIPGELVNADDVPAEPGSAIGTVTLQSGEGDSVGAASFVALGNSTKVNLRVTTLEKGQYKVEVRTGTYCDTQDNKFTGTGNALAGGSLPGIAVNDRGVGSANQTVNVNIGELDGKAMVLLQGDATEPIACGVITAN